MLLEEWRLVMSWPHYEVSSQGRVRRAVASHVTPKGYVMTQSPQTNGYLTVTLCRAGTYKRVSVHRLVCDAFHVPRPIGLTDVAHGDGNKANNCADNLRWASSKDNHNDKRLHGTVAQGSAIAQSKLTEDQVRTIRKEGAAGTPRQTLADRYGVDKTNIGCILRNETWRHV